MAYRLTKRAAQDIRHIHREGKKLFGRLQADRYHLYLKSIFEMLAESPHLAREREEIDPPVRIHPCGSHLVIYIETADSDILIILVRHHRENWQA